MTELRALLRSLGYHEAAQHLPDLPRDAAKAALTAWKAWATKKGIPT